MASVFFEEGTITRRTRVLQTVLSLIVLGSLLHLISVVVLLFYVHDKHLRSCRDGQLT